MPNDKDKPAVPIEDLQHDPPKPINPDTLGVPPPKLPKFKRDTFTPGIAKALSTVSTIGILAAMLVGVPAGMGLFNVIRAAKPGEGLATILAAGVLAGPLSWAVQILVASLLLSAAAKIIVYLKRIEHNTRPR